MSRSRSFSPSSPIEKKKYLFTAASAWYFCTSKTGLPLHFPRHFLPLSSLLEDSLSFSGKAAVKVGRYEILDTVGTGAFSRVVRAHDPFIGRIVAVKIFPSEIARGEAREKFFQEARVIGQISHPCVLALHDMGIDET